MKTEEIKELRTTLGYSQQELATALGVSFATVIRWENGKARPQQDPLAHPRSLSQARQEQLLSRNDSTSEMVPRFNSKDDAEAVKLVIDAHRLQDGHLFNKTFRLEPSRVVPLPHQQIAVYEHLLLQNPLRFVLADDAGRSKMIMTGLHIREMIDGGRMQRAIICCSAGLIGNWRSDFRFFLDLDFKVLQGSDSNKGDSLSASDPNCFIIT
jgi:transcriptional regulator with XRE-family HTH domain